MAKLARMPAIGRAAEADADHPRIPRLRTRYYAFLSYSHKDKELADWLHRELERFRVPRSIAGSLTANGVVPRRLAPIFRDQQDLSAGGDLAEEIKGPLAASQFLVVLCSPTAAKSRWTNQEIESFKRTRPEGCVLAAVVAGEPYASDLPGREEEECFPPALRYKYDRRGHQTAKRAEPLAADFREGGEGKRLAFLKLVAGMLGVGLDELVRREQTRRQQRLAWLAAASLAGMAVTSTLSFVAIQSRDEARDQRRQAEGLVAFMLGDLKDKLEPIGRLDALDGVGTRVLAYYSKQNTSELSDAGLLQRSRALSLMAQVADSRGDISGALRLYREAMRGTAEAMARSPSDPQPMFDHAQNVFYVGQIAHQRGDFPTAEASMREYKRLAFRMAALGPDSMKWRMETQYADTNLGVVLFDQRQYAEALAQFAEALRTIEAIATADPRNRAYQQSVAEALAWLGDAQRAVGDFRAATTTRERHVALLERLAAETGDVEFQQRLIPAYRMLGVLYEDQGESGRAVAPLRKSVEVADALLPREPTNTMWLEYGLKAKLELARQLLLSGNRLEAVEETNAACRMVDDLVRRNVRKREWRLGLSHCWAMQVRLSLAAGHNAQALSQAQHGIEAARKVDTGDKVADAFELAVSYRQLGDARQAIGDMNAAREAWNTALTSLPRPESELPDELAERATILRRAGRAAEAQQLAKKLAAMGYRNPELRPL
jgi:tetratricopeptide (TPR) repeat protein